MVGCKGVICRWLSNISAPKLNISAHGRTPNKLKPLKPARGSQFLWSVSVSSSDLLMPVTAGNVLDTRETQMAVENICSKTIWWLSNISADDVKYICSKTQHICSKTQDQIINHGCVEHTKFPGGFEVPTACAEWAATRRQSGTQIDPEICVVIWS